MSVPAIESAEVFSFYDCFLSTRTVPLRFPTFFLPGDQHDIPPLLPRSCPREPKPVETFCSFPGESVSLSSVISYLERRCNSKLDVNDIVSQFCVKRKTVFDLMSIMCSLGIAAKSGPGEYTWKGVEKIDDAIVFVMQTREGAPVRTLQQEFFCAKDASLGNISLSLLKLFTALGVTKIELRSVAGLFGHDCRYTSMLRRLVTICSCLQAVGVLKLSQDSESAELVDPKIVSLCKQTAATRTRLKEFAALRPMY